MSAVPDESQAAERIRDLGPVFPVFELGLLTNGWKLCDPERVLSSDQCSRIVVGRSIRDESFLCAIKSEPLRSKGEIRTSWREITAMRCLDHENIVRYYCHFVLEAGMHRHEPDFPPDVPTINTVMEFGDCGTLYEELLKFPNKIIPEEGVLFYAKQILAGVGYMHGRRITHGDLHNNNILLKTRTDHTKRCLICDFGAAHLKVTDQSLYDIDMEQVITLIKNLIYGYKVLNKRAALIMGRSKEAIDVCSTLGQQQQLLSAMQLQQMPWFSMDAVMCYPPGEDPPAASRIRGGSDASRRIPVAELLASGSQSIGRQRSWSSPVQGSSRLRDERTRHRSSSHRHYREQ